MTVRALNAGLLFFAGFLVGGYFKNNDISKAHHQKEIITTNAPNIGRQPASQKDLSPTALSESINPDLKLEKPVDLAAYLLGFSIRDVHEACEFADLKFQKEKIETHAHRVRLAENRNELAENLSQIGKQLAQKDYWLGQGLVSIDGVESAIEVLLRADTDTEQVSSVRSLTCFYVDVRLNISKSSPLTEELDICTDALTNRNGDYLISWDAYKPPQARSPLSVMLIPIPQSKSSQIEFLPTNKEDWESSIEFKWTPISTSEGLRWIEANSRPDSTRLTEFVTTPPQYSNH